MELRYELTRDDFFAYEDHAVKSFKGVAQSWALRAPMPLAIVAAFAYYWLVTRRHDPFHETFNAFLTGLVIVLAFVVLKHTLERRTVKQQVQQAYADVGVLQCVLSTSDEGIVFDSGLRWERWLWRSVNAVEESERHIYVRCKPYDRLIIPKRAFENAQHIHAFLDEMVRLRAAAHAQSQA
jgi:hypothetical protein